MIFNKTDHVPERVSQKYADFMREFRLCPQTVRKLFQQTVQVCPHIPDPAQKTLASLVRQRLFQAVMPVHKDEHRVGTGTLQKNLNGKPEGRQPLVPLENLPAGGFRRGMIEAKNVPRTHPRQRGGALSNQYGLKGPGNVPAHHAASFRPSSLQASSPSASGASLIIRPFSSRRPAPASLQRLHQSRIHCPSPQP